MSNLVSDQPLYKVYIDAMSRAFAGTEGVITGCAPTIPSVGLRVDVSAGSAVEGGVKRAYAGGNVTLNAAHATLPRVDLVYLDSAGALQKATGTAAAAVDEPPTPLPPALPASGVLLAVVNVPANAVTLVSGNMVDGSCTISDLSWLGKKGATIASAATLVPGLDGDFAHVSGTTGITAIAAGLRAGYQLALVFDGILTITHNATSLILQGGVNLTTAPGDVVVFVYEGSNNWRELSRRLAAASSSALTYATANCTADVTMTNANQAYDVTGASLSLPAGTWLISAVVEFNCTTTAHSALARIWDGTTTFSVGEQYMATVSASGNYRVPLGPVVVVLGSTTTVKLTGYSPGAGNTIKRYAPNAISPDSTAPATHITAVKIA